MFTDAFPIISTPDIQRALTFYRDLLGAEVRYRFPPEGDPGYVAMRIGNGNFGLAQAPDVVPGAGGQRLALSLYADDCDSAVERLRAGGAIVTQEPTDQPWGERVAKVLDFDGNDVIVGQDAR